MFLPHILRKFQAVNRVDVVRDTYKEDSLRAFVRQSLGEGEHLRVTGATNIPRTWKTLLLADRNKTE